MQITAIARSTGCSHGLTPNWIRIMKLTAILLLSAVMQVSARTEGQTITLNLNNKHMKEVFRAIQKQSGLSVLIDEQLLEKVGNVTIHVKDMPVGEVLDVCLRNKSLVYSITDGRIVVKTALTPANQSERTFTAKSDVLPPIDIRGRITNESGEPVEGASITIKGSNKGTATDAAGNFTLQVPGDGSVLVISYVGYQTIEKKVSHSITEIKIVLVQMESKVEDVVVIGYGTQRKTEVTSAVAHVSADDFIKGSTKDAGQLIQGKIAGLAINNVSGDPTASSQILLRGISTLYSSTQPLILIDGIPGDLATVMPNDIESIDVLKDGSAAAIYGTRGTNGVIIINTRKASGEMKATVKYDGWVSTEEFTRLPKIFTASEYREKITEGVAFSDLGASTDWIKEITRKTPVSHNHNLSVSGGNSKTNYFGTINYRQLQGLVLNSNYQTINTRLGLNHKMFNDRLKITIDVIANENKTGVDFNQSSFVGVGDGGASGDFVNQALLRNPTEPIRQPDGTWYENTVLFSFNPLGILRESFGGSKSLSNRISGSATWEPIDNLHLKVLGFRGQNEFQSGIGQTKRHVSNNKGGSRNGFATKSFDKSTDNLLELTADYTRLFNNHKITGVAGYSYQDNVNESTFLENYDFPAGNFSYLDNIGLGAAMQRGEGSMNSSKYESNLIGFFGRVNYSYKEKYLLMGSLRYEASSKLEGTEKPWGLFPAISAGWRISQEEFMQGSLFSNLKLRAGYGVTGTAPSPYFLGVELLGFSGQIFYNGRWVRSLAPISNPNPFLRWEEKKETNIGLDFGILKGRLSGSIDYYNRTTDGLLYAYAVPTPPNAFGITIANVGVMKNNGLEILLSGRPVQAANFSWTSTVTFSTNKNKLVSISNDLFKATQDWFNTGNPSRGALNTETYTHRVEVGKPIGNFYGHKVIDITDDGQWVYEDKDGKPTTDRLEENKKVIGNGLPKYFGSWNNTFRYRSFDLYVNMRGAFVFDVLNFQRMTMENPNVRLGNNQLKSAYDKVFGKAVLNSGTTAEYNSYYLEKGDFVKIDNISLGYSFKNMKHLSGSRLYISVLNGIILTRYKGMDPEVPLLGLDPGNDNVSKYPSTRVYTIGWNVTFN